MKKFKYTGTGIHAVSLREQGDVIMHEDQDYDLDENNDHIKSLIAFGKLKEVEPETSKKSKPIKKDEI